MILSIVVILQPAVVGLSVVYSPYSRWAACMPQSLCTVASNIRESGFDPLNGLCIFILIASSATPHDLNDFPSAAYISWQLKVRVDAELL